MRAFSPGGAWGWLFVLLALPAWAQPAATQPEADPLARFSHAWIDDAAWEREGVEVAVYDVTNRELSRADYRVTAVTHLEWADPATKTRSARPEGREAIKRHVSYRTDTGSPHGATHSVVTYVGRADFKSLKAEAATIDHIGATFKRFVNHKGTLEWQQFSYRVGEGGRGGSYAPPRTLVFRDALPTVLRGLSADGTGFPITFALLPGQDFAGFTAAEPEAHATLRWHGAETLELPIGATRAHRVTLHRVFESMLADPKVIVGGAAHYHEDFWIAADPKLLGLLVAYDGPGGRERWRLRSVAWERRPAAEPDPAPPPPASQPAR